jgi:hypothetical protein
MHRHVRILCLVFFFGRDSYVLTIESKIFTNVQLHFGNVLSLVTCLNRLYMQLPLGHLRESEHMTCPENIFRRKNKSHCDCRLGEAF